MRRKDLDKEGPQVTVAIGRMTLRPAIANPRGVGEEFYAREVRIMGRKAETRSREPAEEWVVGRIPNIGLGPLNTASMGIVLSSKVASDYRPRDRSRQIEVAGFRSRTKRVRKVSANKFAAVPKESVKLFDAPPRSRPSAVHTRAAPCRSRQRKLTSHDMHHQREQRQRIAAKIATAAPARWRVVGQNVHTAAEERK